MEQYITEIIILVLGAIGAGTWGGKKVLGTRKELKNYRDNAADMRAAANRADNEARMGERCYCYTIGTGEVPRRQLCRSPSHEGRHQGLADGHE